MLWTEESSVGQSGRSGRNLAEPALKKKKNPPLDRSSLLFAFCQRRRERVEDVEQLARIKSARELLLHLIVDAAEIHVVPLDSNLALQQPCTTALGHWTSHGAQFSSRSGQREK